MEYHRAIKRNPQIDLYKLTKVFQSSLLKEGGSEGGSQPCPHTTIPLT